MSTQELILGCQTNNSVAQRQLYKNYFSVVSKISGYYVKDEFDKKDLIQETFILIFTNISNFKGSGSFEGWIKTIARNSALAFCIKNKKRSQRIVIDSVPDYYFASNTTMPEMTSSDVHTIVNRLPSGYKNVFTLHLEGYSHKEIAGILKISEGTSKSQFFHARNSVKTSIMR